VVRAQQNELTHRIGQAGPCETVLDAAINLPVAFGWSSWFALAPKFASRGSEQGGVPRRHRGPRHPLATPAPVRAQGHRRAI